MSIWFCLFVGFVPFLVARSSCWLLFWGLCWLFWCCVFVYCLCCFVYSLFIVVFFVWVYGDCLFWFVQSVVIVMISFNLITSFNVKVFLYSNSFDTRNSSQFFPACCLTNCIPQRPKRVFVASCTLHFGAQPVLVAIFAPMCTYLSNDTGELRSNSPVTRHEQCCIWYCSGLRNCLYCQHAGLW